MNLANASIKSLLLHAGVTLAVASFSLGLSFVMPENVTSWYGLQFAHSQDASFLKIALYVVSGTGYVLGGIFLFAGLSDMKEYKRMMRGSV